MKFTSHNKLDVSLAMNGDQTVYVNINQYPKKIS